MIQINNVKPSTAARTIIKVRVPGVDAKPLSSDTSEPLFIIKRIMVAIANLFDEELFI
jgi:hypothetical protein